MRVKILKDYVKENFPSTPLLDYALEVEKITTSKVRILKSNSFNCFSSSEFHYCLLQKPNLILNVDGIIGVAFVDLLRNSGCFTR